MNNQIGIQTAAMRVRALPNSISELTSAISVLEQTLYALRSQLDPVLDHTLAQGCAGVDKSSGPAITTLHASEISDLTTRIRGLVELGTDLQDRLHV